MKCQICQKEHNRQSLFCSKPCSDKDWRLRNKDRKAEMDKQYRLNNKEKISLQHKARYEANKDEIREYKRRHYLEHRAEIREKHRIYRANHIDLIDKKKKEYRDKNRIRLNEDSLKRYYKDSNRKVKALARHYGQIERKDRCERCSSTENLEFHHTDYRNRIGLTLCKKCHIIEHRGVYYEREDSNKS